ncbi:MAG: chemotaxis protein CheD [Candidatus Cloacimonetes bacterium]|nr:chemotaxis protein CheD [Candidatus Cloacimonadota bacterium]
MSKFVVVNIADMKVSQKPSDTIITYSLGSCIALVLYDPVAKIGGMIHIMLPDSSIEKNPDRMVPLKYVDTAVPMLFKKMFALGAKRNRIETRVAGGSNVMDKNRYFNIGERNHTAVRKILWRNNIMITGEDIGGTKSRTVKLFMDTGKVFVSNSQENYEI